MKKIYWFFIVALLFVSCKVDHVYYMNYVYVNNSGVEVAIVGRNKRYYPDVPDSLVIANGASYVTRGTFEDPGPYEPNLGESSETVVKVYFNKETLVVHGNDSYLKGVRNIRKLFSYSYVQTGERTSDAIYTFTPEDYQLALDLQKK